MRLIIIFFLAIITFSCSTTMTLKTQTVKKGTRITTYKEKAISRTDEPRTHTIYIYEAYKRADVRISISEDKIRIKPYDFKNEFILLDSIVSNIDLVDPSDDYRIADKYAFSPIINGDTLIKLGTKTGGDNLFYTKENPLIDKLNFTSTEAIRYSDNKCVFQTFTIPIKMRSKKGDIPSNVSTNFNAGIAYGYQWNLKKLKPIYNKNDTGKVTMAGYDQKTLSFALSPFAGLTPVSLDASNTNNTITDDRTVLGVSFGGTGVFTFNRFNIGLALGFDYGLNSSKDWIYQGELWTGIVLGLDLIK